MKQSNLSTYETRELSKKGVENWKMSENTRILTTEYSIGKWYNIKCKDQPRCEDLILIDGIQYEYNGITPVDIDRNKKCRYCSLE